MKDALVIPRRSSFEVGGSRYVYVVDKDGVAHRRVVVVKHELGDRLVMDKRIDATDRIIYEGTRRVRDGQKVEYEFVPPDQALG